MLNLTDIKHSRIIISALDWGFGHTTRTTVLIRTLLEQKNQITFAGNQNQLEFIRNELPEIRTELIHGYDISLNSNKGSYKQIFLQIPKMIIAIKKERNWLEKKTNSEPFDLVISDNRYGFYSTKIPSIMLTHQTELQIPFGKKIVNHFLRNQINQFSACWIPDLKNHFLSGKLSSGKLKIPTFFIGPLSRFKVKLKPEYQFDYLFLVSGPKPERENFLLKVVQFISKNKLNAAIAIPFKQKEKINYKGAINFEQPNSKELEELINNSEIIISKAGYTTIMDLIPSQKKLVMIPTGGQYEQQYLYQYHALKNQRSHSTDLNFTVLV